MWNRFILSPLLPLAFVSASLLAPMMWGIALNQETRECAGYWGGDEFTDYPLPPGWKAYYPEEDGFIHTDAGKCQLQLSTQDCCQQLGYTFVAENIGEKYKTEKTLQQMTCLCLFSILGLLAAIIGVKQAQRRGRTPKWLQTSAMLWKDSTIRMLSISMIVAFILTVVSLAVLWIYLSIILCRGWGGQVFFLSILNASWFYSKVTVKVATALWYLGAFLLLVLGWKLTEQLKIEWIRTFVRTILAAFLLSPGVFVYTDVNGRLDMWDTMFLPALVCAVQYRQVVFITPFWEYFSWVVSFGLIPLVWLVELCVISLRHVRKLKMRHEQQSEN